MTTRRYAIIGTGHRVEMYVDALAGSHADAGELVALCDPNQTRVGYYRDRWAERTAPDRPAPATYGSFERMLEEARPDVLIVTTVDRFHAQYVIAGLERGLDVLCEKPLTIDEEGCRAIAEAAAASSGELVVTFNYRYSPRNSVVKELLLDGAIGRVTSVHFEWVLDTVHGADYFRRWHRQKANSGGLLVHKAAHHFDLVNWWLADTPDTVAALGRRAFYGPGPVAETHRGASPDPFALDLADDPRLAALYGEAAHAEDGYVRNQDVFGDGIDIEDNMALLVGYEGGPMLSYSLNAHSPWEGYRAVFNGTEGRLELNVVERAEVTADGTQVVDPSARPDAVDGDAEVRPLGTELVLQRHWEPARRIEVPESDTGHGGGDELLLDHLFRGAEIDPLGLRAGYRDGIRSVLVGAAANRAIAEQRLVRVSELGVRPSAYRSAPAPEYAR
ncbi:Gfo/Idh/MocA family protein [Nocardioides sp. NPDC057772]|uniref:Gfo/Idh/MocA family protein n=1 Tax=Nocardioides sp. NPDC057772 TaxID=3346245 RepID=UPI003672524A